MNSVSQEQYGMPFRGKYVEKDIFKPLKLEPGTEVNVSRVLRYTKETGYLAGDPVNLNKLNIAANNIDKALLPGGKVTIFDHPPVASPVVESLRRKGYRITRQELINPPDEDLPAEWVYELIKR